MNSPDDQTAVAVDLLEVCQQRIGYRFNDTALLRHCLMHASASTTRLQSNERLEFLGDAVLGMVVCDELFSRFPESAEGELTRMKSSLVSRSTCAKIAEQLEIEECLVVGKGLGRVRRLPKSVRAAVIESLIAGVYLDGGYEAAHQLVRRVLDDEFERLANRPQSQNFKSQLQQFCQREFASTPEYRVLDERGPDHSKAFQVAAVIEDRVFPSAWGPNKKDAEQRAAEHALAELDEPDEQD